MNLKLHGRAFYEGYTGKREVRIELGIGKENRLFSFPRDLVNYASEASFPLFP